MCVSANLSNWSAEKPIDTRVNCACRSRINARLRHLRPTSGPRESELECQALEKLTRSCLRGPHMLGFMMPTPRHCRRRQILIVIIQNYNLLRGKTHTVEKKHNFSNDLWWNNVAAVMGKLDCVSNVGENYRGANANYYNDP